MRRAAPLELAVAAVAAVLVPYVALGGASYEPTPVADPCEQREWRSPGGLEAALEQVVLSALDGAACTLDVSREELVLALRSDVSLDAFADEQGISRADAERAVREGLDRAVDDAEQGGRCRASRRRSYGASPRVSRRASCSSCSRGSATSSPSASPGSLVSP